MTTQAGDSLIFTVHALYSTTLPCIDECNSRVPRKNVSHTAIDCNAIDVKAS